MFSDVGQIAFRCRARVSEVGRVIFRGGESFFQRCGEFL